MKLELFNEEANKVLKRFASNFTPGQLELELAFNKKMLEYFQVGESYYIVFNFKQLELELVSKEIESILGYHPSEITMKSMLDKLHPEDLSMFLAFETRAIDFFHRLPVEKLFKYKVRYDFRFRKKNGEYIRILHQAVLVEHDENGGAIRTLAVHTDITYLKQDGKPVLSIIGMDGEPSYINIDVDNNIFIKRKDILTKREKQVLKLLAEGKLSKEVGFILSITKQTVDTHRKNMLHKCGLKNTGELVGKAIRNAWI